MLRLQPILSDGDIQRIHTESLDILENVGVDYKTPRALEILEDHGCWVDYERNQARIPADVVAWALQQTRRQVILQARDPARNVILDGSKSFHTTDSQGTRAIDLETGALHDSTAEDLRQVLRFGDALERVDIVNVSVAASDIPAHLRWIYQFYLAFTHTSKPVRAGVLNAQQVPFLVEMVKAVTGSEYFRPIFSTVDCTISPLMHDGPMTEACIELAKLEVPIMVYPMPLAGGTAPVTLGGTVLLHNVEFLSGLVLFQCVNPGSPIIYGTGAGQLDMKTGRYGGSANSPQLGLTLAEMARFYNLPMNMWGLSTKSTSLDALYGYEATHQTLLAYLAGADEIYSMGLLGSAQILSLDKMVLDNHIARQMDIMLQPIKLDDEHLQTDLIKNVGIGGEYLTQRATLKYTRHEYVDVWPAYGTNMLEAVHQEALDIFHDHQLPPLPPGAEDKLQDILKEANQILNM